MKNHLLRATPNGELTKPVMVFVYAVSMAISIVSIYFVGQALPREAWLAKTALTVLAISSGQGLNTIFVMFIKIYQGGRVKISP